MPPFFMECDSQGRIVWMNESARSRFATTSSLLEAVPPAKRGDAERLIDASSEENPHFTLEMQASNPAGPALIEFSRVMKSGDHVIVAGHLRATQPKAALTSNVLVELQRAATQNYFRLLEAGRQLHPGAASESSELPARVIGQLERERARIGRELHSGAGQALAGIKLNAEMIDSELPEKPYKVKKSLSRIHELADQALQQVRDLSHDLYPPDWRALDLGEAIRRLWERTGVADKLQSELHIRELTAEPPEGVRAAVYRAAQEALSNILRHSGATQVRLNLYEDEDRIHLVVSDNGRGFDAEHAAATNPTAGIGLQSLRDEIEVLNGVVTVESSAGGTTVRISVPLLEKHEQ
jgi:signal transduction histidine kinase